MNDEEKNKISLKSQELFNSKKYTDKELITKIYKDSVGFSLDLKDLNITDLIVTRNGTQYYPENSTTKSTIYLNTKNIFSKYI